MLAFHTVLAVTGVEWEAVEVIGVIRAPFTVGKST